MREAPVPRGARGGEPGPVGKVFTVSEGSRLLVGDITHAPTGEQPCLATVIGVWSGKVVGWSMPSRITEDLTADAMNRAAGRENPGEGLIFHGGQGVRCTSWACQRLLRGHGITQPVSRPGNPYDNAVAGSFLKALKREPVNGGHCGTGEGARQDIFKYIELYYSTRRMHSSPGYRSPAEFERESA